MAREGVVGSLRMTSYRLARKASGMALLLVTGVNVDEVSGIDTLCSLCEWEGFP
jgi:hypothetical protein